MDARSFSPKKSPLFLPRQGPLLLTSLSFIYSLGRPLLSNSSELGALSCAARQVWSFSHPYIFLFTI